MASNVVVRARYFNGKPESAESLIRKFKKKCEKAGILQDMRSHEVYLKPSIKKKLKSKMARLRVQKDLAKKQKFIESRSDK